MKEFIDAMQTADAVTDNGALTNSTSGDRSVDLFFNIGAMRSKQNQVISLFNSAFAEDPYLAIRIMLHARDIRGGAGERQSFRTVFKHLCENHYDLALRVMFKIPELGRWDDIISAVGTPLQDSAVVFALTALHRDRNALCAKWMPRKGVFFNLMFKRAGVTPKVMRKVLVSLSDTVEQKMCAQEWSKIDFSKLPSLASARYQKSFGRNDQERYSEYIQKLSSGDKSVKINANAVYPYDVIKSMRSGNPSVADAQWDALPNYMAGSTERILPVVDVSGSMSTGVGGLTSVSCKDVAVSLGMYIAERNESSLKNVFMSFSSDPHFHVIPNGTLKQRYDSLCRSGEDMSTDIVKCFDVMLRRAVNAKLPQEEMPTKLLVLSDMQFDQSFSYGNKTTFAQLESLYKSHNYTMPTCVFWNLNAQPGKVPVKVRDKNVALVSGFSPSILKSLFGESLTPVDVMLDAVGGERYNF